MQEYGIKFKEFSEIAQGEAIGSNWIEVFADLDTPVSIYAKLQAKSKHAFLLESVEGAEKIGRYSFIGYKALECFANNDDVYNKLEAEFEKYRQNSFDDPLPFFHKGFVGYLSFESVQHIEPSLKFKSSPRPQSYMMLIGSLAVFDHLKHRLYLISNQKINGDYQKAYEASIKELRELESIIKAPHNLSAMNLDLNSADLSIDDFRSNTGKEAFKEMVKKAKDYILEGDIFQVVPSHIMTAEKKINPLVAYRALRAVNPSPYLFMLNVNSENLIDNSDFQKFSGFSLVGSSPEMVVKCVVELSSNAERELKAELRPIAGTYRRGETAEEDNKLAEKLLSDPKERAEHVMLVDLARNDLGKVCEQSSIHLAKNMIVEKYSHVLHIVSSVVGKLKKSMTGLELLKACFPAGTLSGAPKIRAMEIINELEKDPRGPYGGCICYIGLDGSLDSAMVIRTMLIEEDKVHLQAGAGVVADSDPESEYQETINKASALMKVIKLIEKY